MKLIILHTNDTHGQLHPLPTEAGEYLGGYARRATFIKQQRAAHPHLLLVDAGDYYQGTRYWHAFRGEPDITLMNMLATDVGALGNHDCDGGVEVLAARLRQVNFPVLCANMSFPPGHPLADAWQPYFIKKIDGIKVAFFSMLIDTMQLYPPDFNADVQVRDAIETARKLVPQLRAQADVVIHLSHLGQLGDVAVAEVVSGIDLIIGGHTHLPLDEPLVINGTPIVRAIAGGQLMGRVEMDISAGEPARLTSYRLVRLDDSFADDPAVAAEIDRWRADLPPERVLGRLAAPIDTRSQIKGGGESAAGNFFTDAMRAYFGDAVDLAFVHMGTLRGDRIYPAGDFTNHDLSEYHPFDNHPVLMEISAPQLKHILEYGASALPYTVGTFLSQAGLRVTIDPRRPRMEIAPYHPHILSPGDRIIRAEFRGEPVDFSDEARMFRIVTDGYMGRGGAGYFVLKEARHIRWADVSGSAVLKWYLEKFSPVNPAPDGRIVILD